MTRGTRTAKCTAMYGQMYYTKYGNMYVQKINSLKTTIVMLQCYTIKVEFMKKRFTIMLEEETIKDLKAAASYYNPVAWRKMLQRLLGEFAFCELNFHNDKRLTGKMNENGDIEYGK